ncbi:acyl carrier protein [bacterium]|nr:acyl carrier protein [bacterium]
MEEKIYQIVGRIMRVNADTLDKDSSPDTVASWDSAKHMDLMMSLEQEFGVEFSEEQIIEMMNVGLIIETLNEILGKK